MTRRNRQGWRGESKRHALAAKGVSVPRETNIPLEEFGDIDISPETIGYDIYDPNTGEYLTTINKESLKVPFFRERVNIALPPEQYDWRPIKQ